MALSQVTFKAINMMHLSGGYVLERLLNQIYDLRFYLKWQFCLK